MAFKVTCGKEEHVFGRKIDAEYCAETLERKSETKPEITQGDFATAPAPKKTHKGRK